jgi:hypothetical protein
LLFIGLIAGLVIFLLKNDKPEEEQEKEPVVIVEKDNYRFENGSLILLDNEDNEIGKYECKNKEQDKLSFNWPDRYNTKIMICQVDLNCQWLSYYK